MPSWLIFARQFKNLLVIILVISAGLSLYLHNLKTAIIMLLIALMNAVVGFFQEHKAESLMNSLEQLVVAHAKVLRGGKIQEIDSSELVPGDVIYLEAGDSVPATPGYCRKTSWLPTTSPSPAKASRPGNSSTPSKATYRWATAITCSTWARRWRWATVMRSWSAPA